MNRQLLAIVGIVLSSLTPACTPSPGAPQQAATTQDDAAAKSALIQRIAALPENSIYEERKEDFITRLNKEGIYWTSSPYNGPNSANGRIEYLRIGGDGIWGTRLFILRPKGELYVLDETTMLETDSEPQADTLYRYDAATHQLTEISDKIPLDILAANANTFPRDAWQRIEFFILSAQH